MEAGRFSMDLALGRESEPHVRALGGESDYTWRRVWRFAFCRRPARDGGAGITDRGADISLARCARNRDGSLHRVHRPVELKMPKRNQAVDVYRGFVMLLMMAEVLQLSRLAHAFPGNWFLNALAWNQTHVEWVGYSLHDTIQPGFSFLVGVALPYSIASRLAKGGTFGHMFGHAVWRSLLLIALGIFLRSTHSSQT